MPRSVLEAHAFLTRLTDRERRDRAAAASMRQGAARSPAPSPWVGPVRSLRLGLRCREAGSPQPVERVLWGRALMAVVHADGAVGVEPRCGPVLVKHMQPTDHGFQRRELDNSGERRLEQYRESEEAWLRQRRAASKSRAAAARQQATAALSSLRDEKAFTKRWREWRALERREYDVEDALSEEVSRIRGQRHAYENASWHRIQAFRRQVMGDPTERPVASFNLLGANSAVQMQPLGWGGRRPVILQTASTSIFAGHPALIPSTPRWAALLGRPRPRTTLVHSTSRRRLTLSERGPRQWEHLLPGGRRALLR